MPRHRIRPLGTEPAIATDLRCDAPRRPQREPGPQREGSRRDQHGEAEEPHPRGVDDQVLHERRGRRTGRWSTRGTCATASVTGLDSARIRSLGARRALYSAPASHTIRTVPQQATPATITIWSLISTTVIARHLVFRARCYRPRHEALRGDRGRRHRRVRLHVALDHLVAGARWRPRRASSSSPGAGRPTATGRRRSCPARTAAARSSRSRCRSAVSDRSASTRSAPASTCRRAWRRRI